MNQEKIDRNSFGIIEVLISGIIVITIIGAALVTRQRSSDVAAQSRHEIVAEMLAQEGIEAVRDIRDTNYLATMKDSTGALVRVPWNYRLSTQLTISHDQYGGYNLFSVAGDQPLSTNQGDFTRVSAEATPTSDGSQTMELGQGLYEGSAYYAGVTPSGPAMTYLPSWSLSSPGIYDAGTDSGKAVPDIVAATMYNDFCNGVERVFVEDGTRPLGTSPSATVLFNRADPNTQNFDSRITVSGLAPAMCDLSLNNGPLGYVEYRRQVVVAPPLLSFTEDKGDGTAVVDPSAGNYPTGWLTGLKNHLIRVLVRVSWNEPGRFFPTNQPAVLLATYLTDWRPN